MIYVKPVEGRRLRDPFTHIFVPEHGRWVDESDHFWASALHMGDLEAATPPEAHEVPGGSDEPIGPTQERDPFADIVKG